MDNQTQARIYLSDQRGQSQLNGHKSFHSLNFGSYFDESKIPFGPLVHLNDTILKAGAKRKTLVGCDMQLILVPLVGGLEYASTVGDGFLRAGQAQLFWLPDGMEYEIMNPYQVDNINYLEIVFAGTSPFCPGMARSEFDISASNVLLPAAPPNQACWLHIGRFEGRADGEYTVKATCPAQTGVFVFILEGVFEVQGRLLHARDGLALTEIKNNLVEFEALSNGAVILICEVRM